MTKPHDVIWLEGVPESNPEYGRQWCQDNVWSGEGEPDKYLLATPARENAEALAGALRFILAFYEPGQTYLDTEAWKQAEAGARRALARAGG